MTSTADGLDGTSYGLIHVAAIDAGPVELGFCFFGGEDQFAISPESGPFSQYHGTETGKSTPGLGGGTTIRPRPPRGFQEGPFMIDTLPPTPQIRMRRSVEMTNVAGTTFNFDIVRTVRLLNSGDFDRVFGDAVAVSLEQADVSVIGFETINTLHNHGAPLIRESGLVSIQIRSMFNIGLNTIAIVPFRTGDDIELGPAFCADFFGSAPHGRLRSLPQAALLRADSKFRCQIGVSRKRALPFLGSLDFRAGLMTLVTFTIPRNPYRHDYLSNSYCETLSNGVADFVNTRERRPTATAARRTGKAKAKTADLFDDNPADSLYAGEVVRAYNHGPSAPGETPTARFYGFDVFSSAKALDRGESLTHHQYTAHINADNQTLAYIARNVFGVEYDQVFEKMMR